MDNQFSPPQFFVNFCKICQIEENKIHPLWDNLWKKIAKDFITNLAENRNFSEEQKELIFNSLADNNLQSALNSQKLSFSPSQIKTLQSLFSESIQTNSEGLYSQFTKSLNIEAKQAASAYIKSINAN